MNYDLPALSPARRWRQVAADAIALTKPKVVALLLFTTFAAMFLTPKGLPPLGLVLVTMLGGYLMAGRDGLQRADEAGGIAGREQLLGVGARTVVAAQFLGRGQLQLDAAVVGTGGGRWDAASLLTRLRPAGFRRMSRWHSG